ncbi:acyl-CoA dehydrogenase family protein [Blastococcus saxobsidens]|uniref:Alkylation response protein AidB-like acyl-CoA dehydrogenase n=1 Tax=Blastococcus saxobsidens TaxID=138336 RepID=A0A4Q7Y8N5_9ACTN|nr:acyl-CoA dehydrogenase family protein [Blastococcus saxobsidens]RZU32375.1 alkylation response protein AidB-like acyl-CoA dehydrogenase [Blastococcus saxobsidens]
MRRPWAGPRLDDEQQAVLDLVDDLTAGPLARVGDDRPDDVDAARRVLADQGLWTLGVAESDGGGGAPAATTLVALARLGGTWPALAWASVQAHAAAPVLAAARRTPALLDGLHDGAPVAVTAADPGSVTLTGGRLTGALDRIDPAGREPRLVLLLDADTAVLVPPEGIAFGPPVARTGLDGALTVGVRLDAAVPEGDVLRGPKARRARTVLDAGAAAIAAGIAEAAAATALDYSAGRVQFGAPLTELPTVRASLAAQAATARALLVTAVTADLDRPDAVAAALLPACDAALDVAAAAVQSHGGYGYMTEYPVEGLLRDAVSLRAAAGAVEAARTAARTLVGADG